MRTYLKRVTLSFVLPFPLSIWLSFWLSFWALARPAVADPATSEGEAADISSIKDKLRIVTDGKGHYLAIIPFEAMDDYFFYGDGKTFYAQRTIGGSAEGRVSFSRTFWEPRSRGVGASFDYHERKYTVQCDKRETELKALSPEETKAMVAAAQWKKARWKRKAYLLARDNTGKYYYVDRMREPEGNNNFRLFAGPKGAIKLQKMVNVVSDSEGDIFSTKTGELRLVLDKHESVWISGKKKTQLVQVPIEDNHVLIYTDLGVYTGEPLGTPCDDL